MSKRPKITMTVARILAERVKVKLVAEAKEFCKSYIDKVILSKEYAKLDKLHNKRSEMLTKMNAEITEAEKALRTAFTNSIAQVTVTCYQSHQHPSVSVKEADAIQAEYIRDTILLKDFYSESGLSHDEIVEQLVKEFMKTAKTM